MSWSHLPRLHFLSLLSPCRAHPPPASHLNATNFSTICRHCAQSPFHRTSHQTGMACSKAISYQVLMKSWTNLWSLPPPMPLPPTLSLSLTPPSLHLLLLSTLLYDTVISLSLSARMNPHPAPPCSLSFFYLFLSGLNIPSPPPLSFILPHPTWSVATAVLLRFMGLLQELPGRKKRQDLKKTVRQYGKNQVERTTRTDG